MKDTKTPAIKTIGSLEINRAFLLRAWENQGFEQKIPMNTLINHCHATPFYQELSREFTNQYQDWKKGREETEFVAAAMISLLKNNGLTHPYREAISKQIVGRIREVIDPVSLSSNKRNDMLNTSFNMRVPDHVNEKLDEIIADTKKALHNCHMIELEYRNIGDDMEL